MKSKFAKIPIALLITLIIGGSVVSAQGSSAPPSYKINSIISIPELKLSKNTYVSDYKYVDITGDKIKDHIILVGTKETKDNIFFENLNIIIQDGKTKKFTKASISENCASGYNPTMFLGDFNGDKIPDALVSMPTGGSGGMETYSLISFKNNKIAYLFDPEKFSYGLEYDVEFKEGFKVDVHVKETSKTYSLDISNMRDIYIELKIYDNEGKLLQSTSGMRNALSGLEVKVINGKNQLVSLQRVVGTSNAETLGYVKGTWDIENNEVKLANVEVVK